MRPYYILNDKGEPEHTEDVLVWAKWFEEHDKDRIVAQDTVGGVRISTVFLAIDHNFGNWGGLKRKPILWESMILGGEFGETQRRYRTRAEAEIGHKELVEMVRGR